jgi:O-antigen/teichoic acid export membrane protein
VEEKDRAGELGTLVRGGIVSLIGTISNSILGFVVIVILGRSLPVRQAGGLFEALAIFNILSFTALLGADWGLLRLIATFKNPRDRVVLSMIAIFPSAIVGSLIALAVFLNASGIAHLVVRHGDISQAAGELRILAPFLPFSAVMMIALAGNRAWSIRESVLVQNVSVPLVRAVILGTVLAIGITPLLGALAWAAPLVFGGLVGCWLLAHHLREPTVGESKASTLIADVTRPLEVARTFWRFSGPRSIAGPLSLLLVSLQIALLGVFSTPKQIADYTVASRYMLLGTFALTSIGYAIAPQLSRLWVAGRKSAVQTVYGESTWWIMSISWPIQIMMAIFAPLLMSILGLDYRGGVAALEILALGQLANTGTGNNSIAILMAGRSRVNLLIEGTVLVLGVALSVLLIPKYGATGAAIALSASLLVSSLIASVVLYRIGHVHPFGSGYGAVAIAMLASYGGPGLTCRMLFGATWLCASVVAVVGTLLYAGWLVLFHRRGWLNLHELWRLMNGSVRGLAQ